MTFYPFCTINLILPRYCGNNFKMGTLMKAILKKAIPLLLVAGVLAMSGVQVSCSGSDTMYKRSQTNKGRKVKSNIKVKGTNKANGRTTRTY